MSGPSDTAELRYKLAHIAEHLAAAGEREKLLRLMAPRWLETKRLHLGVDAYRSLARDVAVALRVPPSRSADLPAYIRLCVLSGTLNALVTDLPPEALAVLAGSGRVSEALAAVGMMTDPDRRAWALHVIARKQVAGDRQTAIDVWRQALSLASADDRAGAGRLRAAIARGLAEAGETLWSEELMDQAERDLSAVGKPSGLPVAEGFADLAAVRLAVGPSPQGVAFLHRAYAALAQVHTAWYTDSHRFTEVFRKVVALAVRAGESGPLRTIRKDLVDEQNENERPNPRYVTSGTCRAGCAAFAIGAAEAGDHDQARWALDALERFGDAGRQRRGPVDSPTFARIMDRTAVGSGFVNAPFTARRVDVDELSLVCLAVATVSRHSAAPPASVMEAVKRLDQGIARMAEEESSRRNRRQWGPTHLEGYKNLNHQYTLTEMYEGPYGMAELRAGHLDNRVIRCIAHARCALALHRAGLLDQASARFARALHEVSGLPAERGAAVAVLLSAAGELEATQDADASLITYISDQLRLEWVKALDLSLDGGHGIFELATTTASLRSGAGDIEGLGLILSRLREYPSPPGLRANLACHLADAGLARQARSLARSVARLPPRSNTVGYESPAALAQAAYALRVAGRPGAARRRLRWAGRAVHLRLFFPPEELARACTAMMRPALLDDDQTFLRRILGWLTSVERPDLEVAALASGIHQWNTAGTAQLSDGMRQLVRAAALTAFGRYDATGPEPGQRTATAGLLFRLMEEIDDPRGVDLLTAALGTDDDRDATVRFHATLAAIATGRFELIDAALAAAESRTVSPDDDWMVDSLASRLARHPGHLSPGHLTRLLTLMGATPTPSQVSSLIELGAALPAGPDRQRIVDAATRQAHRLRSDRPEMLADLARLGSDPPRTVELLALGAMSTAAATETADAQSRPTTTFSSYLLAAAPALHTLDPPGGLVKSIWREIHLLRDFRPDPSRRYRMPYRVIAQYLREFATFATQWMATIYLLQVLLAWGGIWFMSWLGNGTFGPSWLGFGTASGVTAVRGFRTVARNLLTPTKWVAPIVGTVLWLLCLPGAWCAAKGLTTYWFPTLLGPATFPTVLICQIVGMALVAMDFSRRLWFSDATRYLGPAV
ncbi:hypothetical protein [Streptomyces sp. NPDC001604]|uniref:hypothetical protein n=1 Tax=Streptomyces sp. NPDC001604 TaxID=3364593 RepID=UPI003693E156